MNTCLIGFNLTNLLLAILLSKKGFEVDIVFDEKKNLNQIIEQLVFQKKILNF